MRIGADLQNMREAWWIPIAILPSGVNAMNLEMISGDRVKPGSIMVNRRGRRFVNEATNYNAITAAFHHDDVKRFDYANVPCWVVHDHRYLTSFGSIGRPYTGVTPPWLIEAPTLEELAVKLGIPPHELLGTVSRWNAMVASGADEDFERGESAYDRWFGDPYRKGTIEATLGPIDEPPFYALELQPGTMGTKGGPRTNAHAQVIDVDGHVIDGLYAVGNVSSPLGPVYPGPRRHARTRDDIRLDRRPAPGGPRPRRPARCHRPERNRLAPVDQHIDLVAGIEPRAGGARPRRSGILRPQAGRVGRLASPAPRRDVDRLAVPGHPVADRVRLPFNGVPVGVEDLVPPGVEARPGGRSRGRARRGTSPGRCRACPARRPIRYPSRPSDPRR